MEYVLETKALGKRYQNFTAMRGNGASRFRSWIIHCKAPDGANGWQHYGKLLRWYAVHIGQLSININIKRYKVEVNRNECSFRFYPWHCALGDSGDPAGDFCSQSCRKG